MHHTIINVLIIIIIIIEKENKLAIIINVQNSYTYSPLLFFDSTIFHSFPNLAKTSMILCIPNFKASHSTANAKLNQPGSSA